MKKNIKIERKGNFTGNKMIENGELIAVKANKFVQEYRVSLTLQEIRVVNYMIANIDSPKYDKEFRKFRFNTKEFCNMVYPDKKIGDAYKWLPKLLEGLAHKGAWKEVPSTENPGKMKRALIHWVERPEFEEGYITIELNPNLAPYLLQLDKSFFKSKFQYTALATSKYTIPLYELLKSWEKAYKKKFELTELREYMDALEKTYDNVAAFKRRALDTAVNEINEITDLQVSYTEIKRGRKVTHIEFNIQPKKPVKNSTEQKSTEESDQVDGQIDISEYPGVVPEEPMVTDEDRKKFWDMTFGDLAEYLRNITTEKKEVESIYNLVRVYADDDIFSGKEERQEKIIKYIRSSVLKIEATPEETKTTHYNRLYNMLERKIENEKN